MDAESQTAAAPRPEIESETALARMLDYPLLKPELTDTHVHEGCTLAISYGIAAVVVRPCDVDIAARALRGTGVAVAAAAGFPHGNSTTAAKLYEARDLVRRGATEVEFVMNIGKLISRHFPYIETELVQASKACHEGGAILKVIIETAYLAEDLKLIACKIAKRASADYVSTSTGFAPKGYTSGDLELIYRKLRGRAKMKAGHGIQKLDQALDVYQRGADRIGTLHPGELLASWRERRRQAEDEQRSATAPVLS
ncbi:MAG: deoxyribose-phosphate aldolase [Acidobacteria bacterium]|nr:deoxyribose-phosphate aldolase [Acidobacteriota bacterium]